MKRILQTMLEDKEFVKATIVKAIEGIRLLEMAAGFGFAVLAVIGWSYHGHHRPWEIDVAAAVLVSFCFFTECLFWVVRRLKRPPD